MYLNPGSILGCRLFVVWKGKTCFFFSVSKREKLECKNLNGIFLL